MIGLTSTSMGYGVPYFPPSAPQNQSYGPQTFSLPPVPPIPPIPPMRVNIQPYLNAAAAAVAQPPIRGPIAAIKVVDSEESCCNWKCVMRVVQVVALAILATAFALLATEVIGAAAGLALVIPSGFAFGFAYGYLEG